ncbi:hypothetical protein NQ314_005477 [Rhamnusium bicolor]|uniref:PiggyBac transposable element-derived protein domain-containing protein n=1 Tax=Rhamnusium bicolor TaxID=1586634 RepID=A0AAV8ZJ29_9CUCU|nr:hypothetical protein NQ314_005477 [Rhamnusium bicolor]
MANKWTKNYLTEQELEVIVAHLSDSEDEFDKRESDDEEADLEQELRESILILPIEFEDGLLLQNDVIENIREIQKDQEGGEINEEQTKDDRNHRTEEKEVLEQIARIPKKEAKELKERVYFDNFYASIPLAVHLAKCGILCLGTMGKLRIPNCLLPSDKEMAKKRRGTFQEFVAVIEWVEISSVVWRDQKETYLPLAQFRAELAYCLCNQGTPSTSKRVRLSDLEKNIQAKKRRPATTAYIPLKDVRQDSFSHWPIHDETRQRCKIPGCKSFSLIKCSKCGLHLCLHKNNNCFVKFHTE